MVRTSFNRRVPATAKVATGIVVAAMLGGSAYIVVATDGGAAGWLGVTPLLVFALLAVFVMLGVRRTARHHRVEFSDDGVRVTLRAVDLTVPWSAIDRWALADHGEPLPRLGLCAYPAAGVDPTAGHLRLIWSENDGCWVLCDLPYYHVTPEELVAAATGFAPDKHRTA
jgi:hypothetical protein